MNAPIPEALPTGLDELALGLLVEEVTAKLQAKEPVDIEAFVHDHPEQAEQLRQLLPALYLLADLGRSAAATGAVGAPVVDARDDVIGTVGDFRILREIGRGGMGVVYEALQISLGRRVALKVLPFAATMDARQLQRFQNEVRAAASLQHPHIVPVYAVGCERGVHYYAMQYIDGFSLEAVIRRLRNEERSDPSGVKSHGQLTIDNYQLSIVNFNPAAADTPRPGPQTLRSTEDKQDRCHRIAEWGIQAAKALEHAHGAGMVHRDIKPANLLVDAHGQLWVTDFGLARTAANPGLTMTGDVIGTLRYMSPEQALAKHGLVDHRTDIYALGATIYELLTLRPAVCGDVREEILHNLGVEEPRKPRAVNRSIPADLETIVLKALAKDPADRYGTAQELAEDLERFVRDEPVRARRPSLKRRTTQWCRRHKPLVLAVTVFLVTALLVGAAALWWQVRRHASIEQAVEEDLKEATSWQQKEQWGKALQVLERAQIRLEGSEAGPLQAQIDKRYREASLVARLEHARMKGNPWAGQAGHEQETREADQLFLAVFANQGLGVGAADVEQTARQIRESAIVTPLVAALDYWAMLKDRLPGETGATLRAIARRADKDTWRQRLRDADAAKDPAEYKRLAAADDVLAQPPANLVLLSNHLDPTTAIKLLRQAVLRYPADLWINLTLARLLCFDRRGDTREAGEFIRTAVALDDKRAEGHFLLGLHLYGHRNFAEAEVALAKAVALQPNDRAYWSMFAEVLRERRKLAQAEEAWQKSLELNPVLGWIDQTYYLKLAAVQEEQHKPRAAEQTYRKVIDFNLAQYDKPHTNPRFKRMRQRGFQTRVVEAYDKLGALLHDYWELPRAEQAAREAIGLITLWLEQESQEAGNPQEVAKQEVHKLRLRGDLAMAHNKLGGALYMRRRLGEAAAAYRKAMELEPDMGGAHCNLGEVLLQEGQFGEALASLKRGHELGVKKSNWAHPFAGRLLRRAEQFVALAPKLPRILKGDIQPTDAPERVALARMCQLHCNQLPVTATRLYSEAFAADPSLAKDTATESCYDAACAAALGGCGRGKDVANLQGEDYARLRNQARDWLRADLTAWRTAFSRAPFLARASAADQMRHWQHDPDFNSVRGSDGLDSLPEAERQEWRKLWKEVEELRQQALEEITPPQRVVSPKMVPFRPPA